MTKTKEEMRDLGSETARGGFRNEEDVIKKFNNWKEDSDAQEWLKILKYKLEEIEFVKAIKITREKTDVQVQVSIKLKKILEADNIQVKLVSNTTGFNQIDKRWIHNYKELWDIPYEIEALLRLFTGEDPPTLSGVRDRRRMFIDEFSKGDQNKIVRFFQNKQTLIVSDILKGRGKLAAEWMLVIKKVEDEYDWVLEPINKVLNYYGNGEVLITPRGSLNIGRITMQRKGGDGGRDTAKMLQFKINPLELFELME